MPITIDRKRARLIDIIMGPQAIKEPIVDSAWPNGNMRSEDRARNDSPFFDDQGQALLGALRNFILPLVQTAVPTSQDMSKAQMGPEANDFLVALQKFISSLVRNQSHMDDQEIITATTGSVQDVNLVPEAQILAAPPTNDVDDVGPDNFEDSFPGLDDFKKESLVLSNIFINEDLEELDHLLMEMRAEIFNSVPIRLLHFEKADGSTISDISLLTRQQIFSYCAEKFTAEYMPLTKKLRRKMIAPKTVQYAILSHTWLHSASAEVSFDDWRDGTFDRSQAGYLKLVNFCKVAASKHGVTYGWMDTVCIDKSSSSELDESIRSMFKWYRDAEICITYLAKTTSLSDMAYDPWFTRGWTLQELLVPNEMKFYDHNWAEIIDHPNDKNSKNIQEIIQQITTISDIELFSNSWDCIPTSRKMQWALERQVTRAEDTAYSLMGIFDVSISIAYGEGEQRAYIRLIKEIFKTTKSNILDIFNWGGHHASNISLLLPKSVQAYRYRSKKPIQTFSTTFNEPILLCHLGLRVPALIIPVTVLHAPAQYIPKGDYYATLSLTHPERTIMSSIMKQSTVFYNLLDVTAFGPRVGRIPRFAFAVLNCGVDDVNLCIPLQCFAVGIAYFKGVVLTPARGKVRIPTNYPITFQLQNDNMPADERRTKYSIRRSDLGRHGMQFLNVYL